MPIQSFKCADTQALHCGVRVKRCANIETVARRKPVQLHAAAGLEVLKGARAGQYSIRINSQWRVCFVWTVQGPAEVEIVDDH